MKKILAVACLFVFLSGFSNIFAAETQYEEFAFPETLSDEEYGEKIDDLFYTMRSTAWGSFPHKFTTDEEKRAYRKMGYQTIIDACQTLNARIPEDEIQSWNIYRISEAYRQLYNDAPESERSALMEKLKQEIARYEKSDRLKEVVTDIYASAELFPLHLEIMKPGEKAIKARPLEEQKQLIRRFCELLEANKPVEKGITMELADDMRYGFLCYLEKLAADDPTEKEYVVETLKNFRKVFGEKFSRDKPMGKIVERLEMTGKTCPWKLPVFESEEFVDFSQNRGRISLITFLPVFTSHTLHLQYAQRLWKDKGLDVYCVDHRYSEYLRETLAAIGLDWTAFQTIPEDEPDRADYRFLKRYLGVYDNHDICILIDRDGTVLDSNLSQRNAIARLEEIFGKAPYDITEKADAFIQTVADGKFKELSENCPPEELPQLLADISLVSYRRSGGSNLKHGDALLDLAWDVYKKSPNEKDKEFAIDIIIYYVKWFENFGKTKQEFLAETLKKVEADGHTRLADKIRWAMFREKFNNEMDAEKFVKLRDEVFTYLREHPKSVVPDDLFSLFSKMTDISEKFFYKPQTVQITGETCLACSKILQRSENKEIRKTAEHLFALARRALLIGKEMPLEGITLEGKAFDKNNYTGKVVLIDFWATWCGPCIAEIPKLKKHYEKYHPHGFEIVGISIDDDLDALAEFLRKNQLPWTCLADKKLEEQSKTTMAKTYGVTSIPEVILIDRDGKVVLLNARGQALEEKLAEIFPEIK